jgi:hypothetical protein
MALCQVRPAVGRAAPGDGFGLCAQPGDGLSAVLPSQVATAPTPLVEAAPFNLDSWNRWVARGRASDARLRVRVRRVGLLSVAGAIALFLVWTMR